LASGLLIATLALTSLQGLPPSDKSTRTPAQQKISSSLLDEIRRAKERRAAAGKPPDAEGSPVKIVKIDRKHRALVDVRATVTSDITHQVTRLGGTIVSTWPVADSVIAWVPLLKLEQLAESSSVRAIQPADQANHK
jgi:hypothetical protein